MELISDYQQKIIQNKIVDTYSVKKQLNPAFSMRSFSKKIEISSGALSEILQNKRKMTIHTAKKILSNLNVSSHEIEQILGQHKSPQKRQEREFSNLPLDQYEVLSSWHYLALLNLLELKNVKQDFETLGERLNLPAKTIAEALKRLLRLKMIEIKKGKYVRTFIRYQTSEDVANSAIKKYHHDTIGLSEEALKNIDIDLRDLSSVVLKLNPKNIKNIKKLIRDFQDEICDLVEEDDPSEIYHLNVHLYPVTKKLLPKNIK